jgi:hypothetical protein
MVFLVSPLLMTFERFRNQGVSIPGALTWEPDLGSRIQKSPRKGCAGEAFTLETGGGHCLQLTIHPGFHRTFVPSLEGARQ